MFLPDVAGKEVHNFFGLDQKFEMVQVLVEEVVFFSCIAEPARGIVGQLSDISSRARQLLS